MKREAVEGMVRATLDGEWPRRRATGKDVRMNEQSVQSYALGVIIETESVQPPPAYGYIDWPGTLRCRLWNTVCLQLELGPAGKLMDRMFE